MTVSYTYFALAVVASFIVVFFFYRGVKVNVRRARMVAENLEKALDPEDKLYTWLGGVIGFTADYKVKGFRQVKANFRMIPRHVFFWIPINWLLGRKDNLQLLFFLEIPVSGEFHIIVEGKPKPKIYNKNLYRESLEHSGRRLTLMFDSKKPEKKLLRVLDLLGDGLRHVALTPARRVFYVSMDVEDPSSLSESLGGLCQYLRRLRKL